MQKNYTVSNRWANGNPFIKPKEIKPIEKSEMTEGAKKYYEKKEREKSEDQHSKVFVTHHVSQNPEKLTPTYIQEPSDVKKSEQEKHSIVSLFISLNDIGKQIHKRTFLERYSWKNETTVWNHNGILKITHQYAIRKVLDLLDINYKGQWTTAILYNNLWKKKPIIRFKNGICITPDNKPLYKYTPEGDEILSGWELHFSEETIFTIPRELLVNHIAENKKYKKLQNKIYG